MPFCAPTPVTVSSRLKHSSALRLLFAFVLFFVGTADAQSGHVSSIQSTQMSSRASAQIVHPPVLTVGPAIYLFSFQPTPEGEVPVSLLVDDGSGVVQQDLNGYGFVQAGTDGNFSVSGLYADQCPTSNSPIYLVALGGDLGYGTNLSFAEMSAFPVSCSNLPNVSQISVNELTTAAAAYAFAQFPFSSVPGQFWAPGTNEDGLNYSFEYANRLVDALSGQVNSVDSHGGLVPVEGLNTVADILSSCTRTASPSGPQPQAIGGGGGGGGLRLSPECSALFSAVSPVGNSSIGDTISAAVRIAADPTYNVANIYALLPADLPYTSTLAAQPVDWTMPIAYGNQTTTATIVLDSDINPSTVSQPVTFTASVTPALSTPVPAGAVLFLDNFGGSVKSLGQQSLVQKTPTVIVATLITSTLAAGVHQITAEYVAPNVTTVTSSPLYQVVSQISSQITLTSNVNPTVYGSPATFLVQIPTSVGSGGPYPSGTLTFSDGSTVLGSESVSGSTSYTYSNSSLTVGSHPITVSYSGDANYVGSISQVVNQVVTAASTSTTVSLTPNPVVEGQTVTFGANVSGGNATGSVTFYASGGQIGMATLNSTGQASLQNSALSAGTYSITATYSGDSNNQSSTSSAMQLVVNAPTTTFSASIVPSSYPYGYPVLVSTRAVTNGTPVAGGVQCSSGTIASTIVQLDYSGAANVTLKGMPLGTGESVTCQLTPTNRPNSMSATTSVDIVQANSPVMHSGTALPEALGDETATPFGASVLITGGTTNLTGAGQGASNAAFVYQPGGTWQAVGAMNQFRTGHQAVLLSNSTGDILVMGGMDKNYNYLNSAELYHTGTFGFEDLRPVSNMHSPRMRFTATLLFNGQVLITGGIASGNSPTASTDLYNPDTKQFIVGTPMHSARTGHTATRLNNGKVLIAGGFDGNYTAMNAAEIYDPAYNTFTPVGSMSTARGSHTATLLADGNVLIVGGMANGNASPIQSAEIYDVANNVFTMTPLQNQPVRGRAAHSAVTMLDGNVLISGGRVNNADYLSISQETFDPRTYKFTQVADMDSRRGWFASTILTDGSVALFGGYNGTASGSAPESNVGIYSPDVVYGTISPKYIILSVKYAPPGNGSSFNYQHASAIGTSTDFTHSVSQSSSTTSTFGASGTITTSMQGILNFSGDYSSTTSFAEATDSTQSYAVTQTTTTGESIFGPTSSAVGVDHTADMITIWLNPLLTFSVPGPDTLVWNGYDFDTRDVLGADGNMDTMELSVWQLQHPGSLYQQQLDVLARAWDANGSGAINATDLQNILAADPFVTNPSFDVHIPQSDGVTCSRRFDNQQQAWNYQDPGSGVQPTGHTYNIQTQTTSKEGQTSSYTYGTSSTLNIGVPKFTPTQVLNTLRGVAADSIFKATVSDSFKTMNSMTWSNKWSTTRSTTETVTNGLTLKGPAYTDHYSGPVQMELWRDNVYGTWLLYPVPVDTNVTITASSTSLQANQPVTLTANVAPALSGMTPGGTVTFQTADCQTLGTATVDGSGKANLSLSNLTTRAYVVTAIYSGDSTYSHNFSQTPVTLNVQ